jgi:uncharacterized protein (DUF2249 family)
VIKTVEIPAARAEKGKYAPIISALDKAGYGQAIFVPFDEYPKFLVYASLSQMFERNFPGDKIRSVKQADGRTIWRVKREAKNGAA